MVATHYDNFLSTKHVASNPTGFEISDSAINPLLKDWQREVVRWALRRGRSALFEGTGLGKTFQQLEWANQVHRHTGKDVLILSPLAVGPQTVREAIKFNVPEVALCRTQEDVKPGISVTNYEMLSHFNPQHFGGVVLDEASILKSYMGKTKQALCEAFIATPYRLCCTATPAPNDNLEIGNQSQFLGVMNSNEMISRWFINDTMNVGHYRLKGHAEKEYWKWVASWAVCLTKPSDLGFDDTGYILSELQQFVHVVDVDATTGAEEGMLYRTATLTATTLHEEMRLTAGDRAKKVAEIVGADPDECWIIWCNTNYEADAIAEFVPSAKEIRGDTPDKLKLSVHESWIAGESLQLLSKPRIFGMGLNWQHCARMVFVGLSYSFEQTYQAIRRCWRFGQLRPVQCHFVTAATEGNVLASLRDKEQKNAAMQLSMVAAMKEETLYGFSGGRQLRRIETNRSTKIPQWMKRSVPLELSA